MAAVAVCAPLARRRADPATALAFAATAILACDPLQILDLGFVFSFATAGALVLARPWFDALRKRHGFGAWLARKGAVALVAWLVSTPLTAMCFGRVSLAALPCNVVVVPLAGAVVALAIASMAFFPLLPAVSGLCNVLADALARALVVLARAASSVPGAAWEVAPWPAGAVAAWFGCAALLWFAFRRRLASEDGAAPDPGL